MEGNFISACLVSLNAQRLKVLIFLLKLIIQHSKKFDNMII